MAAVEPGNKHPLADELHWLEFSQHVDVSAASVWAPDYQEDDEITLQCKRVGANDPEQVTTDIEEVSSRPKARQVRILDESQVLPGEASFATVSLNRPSEENTSKPREPIENPIVEELSPNDSAHRVRLLDESQILAGEASYATVMLDERMGISSHSPIAEFLEKTRLTRHQLMLCGLLAASVLAFAVIVVLKLATSEHVAVGPVQHTENRAYAPPNPADAARQTETTLSTKSIEPAIVSTSRGQVSSIANLNGVTGNVKGIADMAPMSSNERTHSEESRNTSANNAKSQVPVKSEVPVTANLNEAAPVASRVASRTVPVESKKKLSESAAKKLASAQRPQAVSVRSDENKELSAPAAEKSESAPAVKKTEISVLPVTGGGERPRTVTRRVTP